MATAATVLPPHATTVAMKTPAATAMAEAQTIYNQLKAATATLTERAIMTEMMMIMETKAAVAAAEARQQHGDGGSLAVAVSLSAEVAA